MGGAAYDGDSGFIKGNDGSELGTRISSSTNGIRHEFHVSSTPSNEAGFVDSFNRPRVSMPFGITQHSHVYDDDPIIWDEALTGGGTSTHIDDESAMRMTVGTASGDKVVRRTYRRFQYYKGKSQQVLFTGRFGTYATGVRARYGYFDDSDGLFFEVDGGTVNAVRRTSTSGSVVDNKVAQASWNIDPLDGTGPSGVTLDLTKTHLFYIDFSWLGVNAVRWGLVLNGRITYVHSETFTNVLAVPFMKQAILPMSAEIENTSGQGSSHDMTVICSSVITEGERTPIGRLRVHTIGATQASVGSDPTIIGGIRLKSSAERLSAKFTSLNVIRSDQDDTLYWRLLLRPDLSGESPVWADLDGQSQYLTNDFSSVTEYSADFVIGEGFVEPGAGAKGAQTSFVNFALENDIFLGCAIDGTRDEIVLEVRRVDGSGNQGVRYVLNYQEFF